ncbi:aldo/keto reductase [Paracoccus litorisediminis]|jgi:aryl-alcohol dehydrogenase-like predicted oxidoreductase|uniref:Aldo/keto reductase n=1 Tax=Paracoccus litorisediminis TaxID=2006130 RepID=A0A844HHJ3_9RHOB|nr:aldo/keto reductase [Paracoccus litorisediminis]MTH59306.1 aldo/keto reductase [Paracoccus litorisediminis]
MTNTPSKIPQVALGRNGPLVGIQGLGCMGISEFYGRSDQVQARATLELALELGVSHFDTADMYGIGANEEFLAPFLRANRDTVHIATKYGYRRSAATPDDWSVTNDPGHIRRAAEASLKRLGVEVIDLYYMHRRDPSVPLAESIGTMADLVTEGKVRALGLCEVSAAELAEAHAIHPIAALQSEWSVFSRDIEAEVSGKAAELGIAIVPFAPLGRGLLTGQLALADDDARRNFPRFAEANLSANMRAVETVIGLARARGVTPAQIALAWLYDRARICDVSVIPIPGTRKPARLRENLEATAVVLTTAERAALEPLAGFVQGARV